MSKVIQLNKEKGIAAIEFTLLVPFFLLIIFVTVEFGRALFQYSQLTRMIRDAGRHLSQTIITEGAGMPTDLTDANCNGCISDTKNILMYGAGTGSSTLLSGLKITDITISEFPIDSEIMVISVDYDWTPIFFDQLSEFGLGNGIDLTFNFSSTYAVRAI
ncbi:pilus assembly protein [Shewanella sp. Isolate13]|uniref:TadE/TadG family type IV pilus assembly protein n=1 Tax=Shewanella sp. Isolate13 TaxID=2908531 RepID=UPI001EFE0D97|nr:TadE family protein [Shewanella sp. Isolate13]MCG9731305.1 pilus assembly protein [Shewanella sp. Isolate13]